MARNTGTGQTAYVYIAVILEYFPGLITFHNLAQNIGGEIIDKNKKEGIRGGK